MKFVVAAAVLLLGPALAPAEDAAPGLRVRILDPAGLPVPGAVVRFSARGGRAQRCTTDVLGGCNFLERGRGPCRISVAASGFEPVEGFEISPARSEAEVRLKVARRSETVEVRERGSHPFTIVLTEQDIAALPDDPEEMQAALEAMAGPGAVIRVNGFRAGRLPAKSAIAEIRFRTNPFRADSHELADIVIDIRTKPGASGWAGRLGGLRGDDALAARPPFSSGPAGDEHSRGQAFLEGPLVRQRTSFSLDGAWSRRRTARGLTVVLPIAPQDRTVASSSTTADLTVALDQALGRTHAVRVEYIAHERSDHDLGVGGLDVPERAYAEDVLGHELRLYAKSTLGSRSLNELRLRARVETTTTVPESDAPAIDVLDAFRAGGAQVEGRTKVTELELADDWDLTLGRNAARVGFQLERTAYESDWIPNRTGTFTFSSLDAFQAGRPSLFTRRLGDASVSFDQTRLGLYAQTDFRAGKDVSVGVGLRGEWQNQMGGLEMGPRGTLAWTPGGGSTTVRVAGGRFFDWFGATTEAEAVRLGGAMSEEVVTDPGYPEPGPSGAPSSSRRLARATDLRLPTEWRGQLAIETRAVRQATISLRYGFGKGSRQLRTRAVPGGPGDERLQNWRLESAARSWEQQLQCSGIYVRPQRLRAYLTYTWGRWTDETDGPLRLPADSERPEDDKGPAADDIRHRFFGLASLRIVPGLWAGVQLQALSAPPYNVVTGRDSNGDSVFNDRPARVGRNAARAAGHVEVGARLTWTSGFGRERQPGGGVTVQRSEGIGAGASPRRRFVLEVYAQAQNLFNRFNPVGFVGVQTSPLFGQPTSARPSRRIEVAANLSF